MVCSVFRTLFLQQIVRSVKKYCIATIESCSQGPTLLKKMAKNENWSEK